ncbi:MAG: hypothetical protein EBU46_00260 [Nitrosomonadaceae bacterium]|nr:hypothetical protein [Nitrosomonadaceae bacterium]
MSLRNIYDNTCLKLETSYNGEPWNVPKPTAYLKWCVQLNFSYKHNWLITAHPNISGRSLQFAACIVNDRRLDPIRASIIHGSVYGFDSLWKRLKKNERLIPTEYRYWTFNNNNNA